MIDLVAYPGLGEPVTSVYSNINEGQYNVTPTRILVKRTDDSSSSDDDNEDSSSKTSKSKSTKCTGTKQQCELPTNSKHTTGVTVGVAVAVPVAVVILLLIVILYFVYRRSKREAQEDNDPDFEGDSEFLPHHNTYEMHNQYSSSDSNQNMREKVDSAFYNGMSMAPPGVSQQQYPQPQGFVNGAVNPFSNRNSSWTADPFQLPEAENTESLREFAKQVHNDGLGGYKLASRNGSQLSLQNDQSSYMANNNRLSNMRVVTNQGDLNNQYVASGETRMASVNNSKNTSPLKNNNYQQPQNLSHKKLDFSQEVETFDSEHDDDDDDDDGFDFESNQSKFKNQPEHLAVETNTPTPLSPPPPQQQQQQDGDNQYASNIPLSPEEENIQRMKSIYKVYLDRNETVRDSNIVHHVEGQEVKVEQNNMAQNGVSATLSPQGHTPTMESATQPVMNVPQIQVQEDTSAPVMGNNDGANNNNLEASRMSHRIASSIYSEAPVQAYHSQLQQQQQQYGYNQDPNFAMMQQQQQNYGYPQQQQQQFYNNYPPLPNMPSQYMHPQTLEQIDELPMPSKLVYSGSSHSLTSFKQVTKSQQQIQQQQNMLQTARLNGTALNPMDHPEMFYATDEGLMQQPQMPNDSSMSFVSNNSQMTNVLSPHQMRKSIVMTNPATLQSQTTYKPAGSLRNIQPQQQMDPYYQQQQQQMHSRVSGILDNTDMIQPPSVGGILPHSGSQEDLRKQLGSSGNYTVQ